MTQALKVEQEILVEHLQDLAERFESGDIIDMGVTSGTDHAKLLRIAAAYVEKYSIELRSPV